MTVAIFDRLTVNASSCF